MISVRRKDIHADSSAILEEDDSDTPWSFDALTINHALRTESEAFQERIVRLLQRFIHVPLRVTEIGGVFTQAYDNASSSDDRDLIDALAIGQWSCTTCEIHDMLTASSLTLYTAFDEQNHI